MSRKKNNIALFANARKAFHKSLLESNVLSRSLQGVTSNADSSNKTSIRIASKIFDQVVQGAKESERLAGQASGNWFEHLTREFVQETFLKLDHLRPGKWDVDPAKRVIPRFSQYKHLYDLQLLVEQYPELATTLGSDYIIAPDIVIARAPETDQEINASEVLVDDSVASLASLRSANSAIEILHASISCKWTLRSDRAQNARSEALNLIRNRKGRLPHIVVVTGEPLPSRLASIALGTGDIDCVYHFALPELTKAVQSEGDAESTVAMMVNGSRLKDISDLPLDLAV